MLGMYIGHQQPREAMSFNRKSSFRLKAACWLGAFRTHRFY